MPKSNINIVAKLAQLVGRASNVAQANREDYTEKNKQLKEEENNQELQLEQRRNTFNFFGYSYPKTLVNRRPAAYVQPFGNPIIAIASYSTYNKTWLWPIKALTPIEFTIPTSYRTLSDLGFVEIPPITTLASPQPPNGGVEWTYQERGGFGSQSDIESIVLPLGGGKGIYIERRVFWHVTKEIAYSYQFTITPSPSGTPCGDNQINVGTLSGNSSSLVESEIFTATNAWLFDDATANPIFVPPELTNILELWWPVTKPTYSSEQINVGIDINNPTEYGVGTTTLTWSLSDTDPQFCIDTVGGSSSPATRTRYISTPNEPDPDYSNILTNWNLRTQYGIGRLATTSHSRRYVYSPAIYTVINNPTGDVTLTSEQNTYANVRLSFLGPEATSALPTNFVDIVDSTPTLDLGSSVTVQAFNFRYTTIEPVSNDTSVDPVTLNVFFKQQSLQGPIANNQMSSENLHLAYDWGSPAYCRTKARELGFVF